MILAVEAEAENLWVLYLTSGIGFVIVFGVVLLWEFRYKIFPNWTPAPLPPSPHYTQEEVSEALGMEVSPEVVAFYNKIDELPEWFPLPIEERFGGGGVWLIGFAHPREQMEGFSSWLKDVARGIEGASRFIAYSKDGVCCFLVGETIFLHDLWGKRRQIFDSLEDMIRAVEKSLETYDPEDEDVEEDF